MGDFLKKSLHLPFDENDEGEEIMTSTHKDKKIADLLAARDIAGLKLLFDSYYRGLCVFALNYVDSFGKAEDIVRDELVAFWEKNEGRQDISSIRAYLYGTVRNASLNHVRRNRRYVFGQLEDRINISIEQFDDMDSDDAAHHVRRLYAELDRLPPRTRAVFTAIVIDEMRYKDVAQRMGISVNTVKTLYARALKSLRNHLTVVAWLLMV